MAEILVGDVPNADQLPEVNLPAYRVQESSQSLDGARALPVEDEGAPVVAEEPMVSDSTQRSSRPLRLTIEVPVRPEPQPVIEPSLSWQQMMDEGEMEDWLEKNYAPSVANRDVVRGPAGQEFSKQGIDPRNLLEDESFGESSRLFDRMVAPYKKAAEAIGNVTWEDVRFANQEAGNAMVTGLGKAAQGFIDLTDEVAEALHGVVPSWMIGYVVWDKDGLRIEEKRPEGMDGFTIPQFWTEPETEVGKIGAGIVQFVSAMAATSMGTLGTIPYRAARYMSYGAVADTLFDPEEGNFSTMLMHLGVEPNAVLKFLGTPVGKDAEAAERLAQRLKNAFEGGLIGLPFDLAPLMFKGFKALHEHPEWRQKAIEHLESKAAEVATVVKQRLAEGKSPIPMGLSIEAVGPGPVVSTPPMSRREVGAINKAVGRGTKLNTAARAEAERIKGEYPEAEGWMPLEVTGVTKKADGTIKDIKFRQPAYAFHNPPQGVTSDEGRQQLTSAMIDDVRSIVERARGGDEAANAIVQQATWYRAMRIRLRSEFGGMGDVFADLLGSTSAQTGVEQNWNNSIEILRRFSRGEYDEEIAAYAGRVEAGGDISSKVLHPLDKAGEFPLIRSAAGSLFNANSPAATGALLDLFRQIKAGSSPKTPNFTGNLIGYTNDATIDVWAARYLRGVSGLDRIPPPAEKAVAGKHLAGSTLDEPRIGGEFKFGQDVFEGAAREINADGLVREYAPDVGELGADDLQAVVWFMEKEKWAANGWTTKAGEGGSLDVEAGFAGQPDQARVKELRRLINTGFAEKKYNALKRKKGEGDAAYETRVAAHGEAFDQKELDRRAAFDQQRQGAQDELSGLSADLERTTLGISAERPGDIPSNYRQAEVAAEFDDVLRGDDAVVAYKANSTIGRFMNADERALDVELMTRRGVDPEPLTRRLVELGKEHDQDSVFISKVVDATHENARPGIEIYFRNRVDMDVVDKVTELLNANNIDGFTFVTDMRHGDRVNVQAMAGGADTAGITGIRMQYVPEYDDTFDAARRVEKMIEMQDKYDAMVAQLLDAVGGISDASVVHYDTRLFFRDDYDDYLAGPSGAGGGQVWQGQQNSPDVPQPADGPRADSP